MWRHSVSRLSFGQVHHHYILRKPKATFTVHVLVHVHILEIESRDRG